MGPVSGDGMLRTVRLLADGPPLDLSSGMEEWFIAFVKEAQHENEILRQNGAGDVAMARDCLLRQLVAKADAYHDGRLTTAEAAELLGCSEETVRRKARNGELPTGRTGSSGHHTFRRGDLKKVASSSRKRYDPIADAQDIAKTRRGAA